MNRRVLARVVIIALLWVACFALVPRGWIQVATVPLRVLPFLDPVGGVAGIAVGSLVEGLIESTGMVRVPSDVEIHKLTVLAFIFMINGAAVLAAIVTARARRMWIAPLPSVIINGAVLAIYMWTSPYPTVVRGFLKVGFISYVVGLLFLAAVLKFPRARRLLDHRVWAHAET